MASKYFKGAATAVAVLGATLLAASGAPAATTHHQAHKRHIAARGGSRVLVNDGAGTAYGFHSSPLPYRIGAWRQRYRQADATHEAVEDDALTSGGYWGFPGDSVYGAGSRAAYGVFNGADGYGSPYFVGFYGPGGGDDYGPFGHAYAD